MTFIDALESINSFLAGKIPPYELKYLSEKNSVSGLARKLSWNPSDPKKFIFVPSERLGDSPGRVSPHLVPIFARVSGTSLIPFLKEADILKKGKNGKLN